MYSNLERLEKIKERRYGFLAACPYCNNKWCDDEKDHIIGFYIGYKLQCPYCEKIFKAED